MYTADHMYVDCEAVVNALLGIYKHTYNYK